jgi:hypothetical protein
MRDVLVLERIEQAEALHKPMRVEILLLHELRSCTEVAAATGQTPQKVYYHVKRMEGPGWSSGSPGARCAAYPKGFTGRPAARTALGRGGRRVPPTPRWSRTTTADGRASWWP